MLVAQTQKSLIKQPDIGERDGFLLVKSLELSCLGNVSCYRRVDATVESEDSDLQENMKPAFPEGIYRHPDSIGLYGTN